MGSIFPIGAVFAAPPSLGLEICYFGARVMLAIMRLALTAGFCAPPVVLKQWLIQWKRSSLFAR